MAKAAAKSTNVAVLRAPLHNSEIADRFDDIAAMLELSEANPFRVRAYRNASRLLRRYGREASQMVRASLAELPVSAWISRTRSTKSPRPARRRCSKT